MARLLAATSTAGTAPAHRFVFGLPRASERQTMLSPRYPHVSLAHVSLVRSFECVL